MHPQSLLRILARILTPTLARTLMAATALPHARLMSQSGNKWIFPKSMAIECSLEKQNHQNVLDDSLELVHDSEKQELRTKLFKLGMQCINDSMMGMAVLEFENAIKSYFAHSCAAQQLMNIFIFQKKIFFIRTNSS